jgi:hypothetical protein
MTVKTKITLAVFGTLVVGIVVGAVGSAALVDWRMNRIAEGDIRDRFIQSCQRELDLTAEQRDSVTVILNRWADRQKELFQKHFQATRALVDSMKAELAPVLTAEQLSKLDRRMERMGKPFRGRPFGPPPPGPPMDENGR